jgi:glutamate synthase (NADPH/NADH) small chain
VVILGGGDTGADCLGTAIRQGATQVHQLEIMPEPPQERSTDNPWPEWPRIFRSSSSHEEGGERQYALMTTALSGDNGAVGTLHAVQVTLAEDGIKPIPNTEIAFHADLVLLAMGFVGIDAGNMADQLGVEISRRGPVLTTEGFATHADGVFCIGDAMRGANLIVRAIADGRDAATQVHNYLCG